MAIFGNKNKTESEIKIEELEDLLLEQENKIKNYEDLANKIVILSEDLSLKDLEIHDKEDKINEIRLNLMEKSEENRKLAVEIQKKQEKSQALFEENEKLKKALQDNNININKFIKLSGNTPIEELLLDAISGISKLEKKTSSVEFSIYLKYVVNDSNKITFTYSPDGNLYKSMWECVNFAEKEYNRIKSEIL